MLDLLCALSAAGQEIQAADANDDTTAKLAIVERLTVDNNHIAEARKLVDSGSSELWTQLQTQKIVLADVARAFSAIISLAPEAQALQAATVYASLLITPGCPVLSLFDRVICGAFLKLLRDVAAKRPTKAKALPKSKAATKQISQMEIDDANSDEEMLEASAGTEIPEEVNCMELVVLCAQNFAAMLSKLALGDQQDTVRCIAETFAEISLTPWLPFDAKTAAYAVLYAVLAPEHGGMRELSAMVFKLLTPHVLGMLPGGKSTAKDASAVRSSALNFIAEALKEKPGCEEAAAALMRNAVLKAPDKADGRAAAAETVVELCRALGPAYVHNFIGFLAKLSRTSKPNQRIMAVEVCPALLQAFDAPFDCNSTAAASPLPLLPPAVAALRNQGHTDRRISTVSSVGTPASLRGWIGADGQPMAPAPWGAVCLAILLQRASDKTPAVRSRALHHLASLSASYLEAEEGAGAFLTALGVAEAIDLRVESSASPGKGTPGGASTFAGTPMSTVARGSGQQENTPRNTAAGRAGSTAGRSQGGLSRASMGTTVGGMSPLAARVVSFPVPAALLAPGAATDLKPLLRTARQRCKDDKGQVRKSAVQLLQALVLMQATRNAQNAPRTLSSACILSQKDLAALEMAAGDPLVSVRKAALTAIAELAMGLPEDTGVASVWVTAGLPLIRDPESSIQDAVLDQLDELILQKAAAAGAGSSTAPKAVAAAAELRPLLAAVSRAGAAGRACLARSCAALRTKGRLQGKKIAAGLERILAETTTPAGDASGHNELRNEEIGGAWLLYAKIATQAPSAPSWEFLHSQWAALSTQHAQQVLIGSDAHHQGHAAQLLRVVATAAAEFPAAEASALCGQLQRRLESLDLSPAAAAAHVAALAQLTRAHGGANRDSTMSGWTSSLLGVCESGLAAFVEALRKGTAGDKAAASPAAAPSALFIVGEVALLRAAPPSSRLVTLVQALTSATLASELAPTQSQALPSEDGAAGGATNVSSGQEHTTAPLETAVWASQGASQLPKAAAVPSTVQALAWVTLGKLCLVNESLAKKCVPLFIQELGRAASPAVRNNIMVALADLVINYTALVDAHIPRLAACLRDPNELVRTQALGLLANLLQKDYVKWRGPLFLRFMLALIDDSPRVAAMAEFLLSDALDSKLPNLAYNHFVEALFVLNDCQVGLVGGAAAAAAMADLPGAAAEREAFCLKGSDPVMRTKRDAIYQALLRRMAPEHKFATSARLCQEVLSGAADGALPLSECSEVIGDALRVLSSSAIKVAASRAARDVDADADASTDAASIVGAAKGRLVSQMMKKHLVEAVVPVIIELKRIMEASKHPLLGSLMAAAAAMLKDHKTEIEDILAADRQLAKEILYDIRQAEAADAARVAEEKEAAAAGAPAAAVPSSVVAAKTPGAPPSAGAAKTPHTGLATGLSSGRRTSMRPAGTSGSTPIAAEVLRRVSGVSGPASAGHGTARRLTHSALPTTAATNRGSNTPRSAGITPGARRLVMAPPTAAAITRGTGSGGATTAGPKGRALSRLARASTGYPGTSTAKKTAQGGEGIGSIGLANHDLVEGGGTNNSPAQLRLRIRPQGSTPHQSRSPAATAQLARDIQDQDKAGGKEEDHVDLCFIVPGAGLGEEVASPRLWNVSPAVVPKGGSGRQGGANVGAIDGGIVTNREGNEASAMEMDYHSGEEAGEAEGKGSLRGADSAGEEGVQRGAGARTRGRRRGRSEESDDVKEVGVGQGGRRKRKG